MNVSSVVMPKAIQSILRNSGGSLIGPGETVPDPLATGVTVLAGGALGSEGASGLFAKLLLISRYQVIRRQNRRQCCQRAAAVCPFKTAAGPDIMFRKRGIAVTRETGIAQRHSRDQTGCRRNDGSECLGAPALQHAER